MDGLDENEMLKDQLQDFLDDFADFFDIDEPDIDDGLESLEDEARDLDDFELYWSVYELGGEYVGLSIGYDVDGTEMEIFYMMEM